MFFPPEQVQKVVLLNAWKIHIFPKWLISAEKSTMIEAGGRGGVGGVEGETKVNEERPSVIENGKGCYDC